MGILNSLYFSGLDKGTHLPLPDKSANCRRQRVFSHKLMQENSLGHGPRGRAPAGQDCSIVFRKRILGQSFWVVSRCHELRAKKTGMPVWSVAK
jgi:hypothetical protein